MKLALILTICLINISYSQDLVLANYTEFEKIENETEESLEKDETLNLKELNSMLVKFVNEKFRYPDIALENQFEGDSKILVSFDEKGQLKEYIVDREIGFGIDEAIDKVMKLVPIFYPAANLRLIIPLRFKMK